MGSRAKLNTSSFLFVAPFSTDSIFITGDLNLDMRFVLIQNYKHVRTAGLTVWGLAADGGGRGGGQLGAGAIFKEILLICVPLNRRFWNTALFFS